MEKIRVKVLGGIQEDERLYEYEDPRPDIILPQRYMIAHSIRPL